MPGTPSTSPRFGAPRFANADQVDFAGQVNGVTDAFDLSAAKFLTGTIATRPTAASVPDRTFYFATDRAGQPDELSVAVGSAWSNTPMGPIVAEEISSPLADKLGINNGDGVTRSWNLFDPAEYSVTDNGAAPVPGYVPNANTSITLTVSVPTILTAGFMAEMRQSNTNPGAQTTIHLYLDNQAPSGWAGICYPLSPYTSYAGAVGNVAPGRLLLPGTHTIVPGQYANANSGYSVTGYIRNRRLFGYLRAA